MQSRGIVLVLAKGGWRACLALLLAAALSATAEAEPRIDWQVDNPFRFFLDSADTEVHRATWASLSDGENTSAVLSAERVLAERHPDGWSATMFSKTCWDRVRNRYSCRERGDYTGPSTTHPRQLVDLEDAQTVDCTWLTKPHGHGPRGRAITLPCDTPVQLEVPYPTGAWISVEIGGQKMAETAARVTDLLIVGMGDSFASGDGNPDVPVRFSPERTADYDAKLVGYPARIGDWRQVGDKKFIEENARWQDQACHRSLYSHQLRVAAAAGRGGPAPRRHLSSASPARAPRRCWASSCATRATSGCPIRRSCRRSPPSPRPSAAAARRASTICPRPTTCRRRSPS